MYLYRLHVINVVSDNAVYTRVYDNYYWQVQWCLNQSSRKNVLKKNGIDR